MLWVLLLDNINKLVIFHHYLSNIIIFWSSHLFYLYMVTFHMEAIWGDVLFKLLSKAFDSYLF